MTTPEDTTSVKSSRRKLLKAAGATAGAVALGASLQGAKAAEESAAYGSKPVALTTHDD